MISGDKLAINSDKVAISGDKILYSKNEKLVIDYLKSNKEITNKQLREIAKIKESAANKILKSLVQKDKIVAIGDKRGRYYTNR